MKLKTGLLSIVVFISLISGPLFAGEAAPAKSKEQLIEETAKAVLYKKAECGKAKLSVINGIPVLHVYGNGSETGKQYGTILKKLLVGLSDYISDSFQSKAEEVIARLMARGFEKYIPKEYVDEMKAIAEATGIDYITILMANAMGEIGCSTFSAWGNRTKDGKLLFGRNLDQSAFPRISDKIGCVIVFHPVGKYDFAKVGVAGLMGAYTAINEKGLSIGNTHVNNAKEVKALKGIPPGYLDRHLLENCATVAEAKKELETSKHTPLRASTLMICDAANNSIVAELGPGGIAFRESKVGVLYSTNHMITGEMMKEDVSCPRFNLFEKAGKKDEKFDVAGIKKILLDVFQKGYTLHSVVFEPADIKMHIAFYRMNRPPAESKYSILKASDLFPAPPEEEKKE
jgi:predicted choloylglycine hydrolase